MLIDFDSSNGSMCIDHKWVVGLRDASWDSAYPLRVLLACPPGEIAVRGDYASARAAFEVIFKHASPIEPGSSV